jgi:phosphatidylinositol alpha 1,6-mannosyltransferase
VVRVIESLWQQGHEVLIISPTAQGSTFMGFPVIRTTRFYFREFPVALPLINLTSLLRGFKPDIVHVAAPFALGRQALAVAKRLGVPSVAIYQTDVAGYASRYGLSFLRPWVDRLVAHIHNFASLNLAPTQETKLYLEGLGVKNVSIWARGVDVDRFHPELKEHDEAQKLRASFGDPDQLVVGFVGRLAPEKQVSRFQEFFDIPNVKFLIVGDGPERATLEKLFSGQSAKFTGELKGDDLAISYAAMDVFVHCGTEETFGQTIQEAQASGLPVIAPDRGGPRHLIDSSVNGFLVDPDGEFAYRNKLLRLQKDTDLRQGMGEIGRSSVLGKSWAANNARLVEHYFLAIKQSLTKAA